MTTTHQGAQMAVGHKSTMTSRIMFVTPDDAVEWLKARPAKQRTVRPGLVAKYASDMAQGVWRLSHQGIAFDTDGMLIDGQHRLVAIATGGIGAWLYVTFGAPVISYEVLDGAATRTITDLDREGWMSSTAAATGRILALSANDFDNWTGVSKLATMRLMRDYKEGILFALSVMPSKVRRVTTASVYAAVTAAYYYEREDELTQFAEVLTSGYGQENRDRTVITIRNWLLAHPQGGAPERREAHLRTQRAIQAFCEGVVNAKSFVPPNPPYRVFMDGPNTPHGNQTAKQTAGSGREEKS
jgi:hypothetical protein